MTLGRKLVGIDYELVTTLVSRGATRPQIAGALGIGERTLYAKLNRDPELQAAIAAGWQKTVQVAESALMKRIASGEWRAIRFIMMRNIGWLEAGFGSRGPEEAERRAPKGMGTAVGRPARMETISYGTARRRGLMTVKYLLQINLSASSMNRNAVYSSTYSRILAERFVPSAA